MTSHDKPGAESTQDFINARAKELFAKLVEIRRDLHRHPELSFQERRTAGIVAEILEELGLDVKTGVAGTGVTGLLRGTEQGKTVALRADMDAIPMVEETDLPYASENNGVMHACGHDIHTSILAGVAMILAGFKDRLNGAVKFVFQPSEEGVRSGARAMIEDGVLSGPDVDAMFGLHVCATTPTGAIHLKPDCWMAATGTFEVTVLGRTAHATAPQLGVDALVMAARIINEFQTISSRRMDPCDPVVLSIVNIHGGPEAFGSSIVDKVSMKGLLRAGSVESIERIREIMRTTASGIARSMGGDCSIDFLDGCPEGINDERLTDLVIATAKDVLGKGNVILDPGIRLGGEDFTFFAKQVPACFLYLGAKMPGCDTDLHTPSVVLDEAAIPVGAKLMSRLALEFLGG